MLVYKKLGFFESVGKYCNICKCRPKYKLYFNNEQTNWSYLCDSCYIQREDIECCQKICKNLP